MPLINADNITKTYGKKANAFDALHGVTLAINKGEAVAIVGKSGSGKSTLMHLLATLDRPTTGSLTIHDQNTVNLKSKKLNQLRNREIGFVFQQFFLNPRESVLENVALPLKIAGVRPGERKKRAAQMLELVNLSDKVKAKAKDLSGGEKQRVCIARALVNNPSIIFADEPTGNLDSATGHQVMKLLHELNQKHGITLIVVTHDLDIASQFKRRINIKDGEIES